MVGFGVYAAYGGLYKVFRFYVGRGQPADLASTVSSQQSVMPGAPTGGSTGFRSIYSPVMLADMLLGRKNPTFKEPEGWLPRMLHSFVRNLIFLPYALRNDAGSRFVAAAHSVVLLALLGLAWFSGVTNLVPMDGTPVMAWLVTVVTVMLLVIWFREALRKSHAARAMLKFSFGTLVAVGGARDRRAVRARVVEPRAAPARRRRSRHTRGSRPMLLAGFASFGFSLLLALRRAPQTPPPTLVSEYREHWQESVHPMDIFRAVEITLAKHRFQEIPNRVYENDVPELMAQGSQNKGEFGGRTVQEVQPRPVADRRGDGVIQIGIVAGQAAAARRRHRACSRCCSGCKPGALPRSRRRCSAPSCCGSQGRLLARTSTLYVSEIEFESDLIVFAVTGTFSESRVATGMSIYDSTRSENTIVRSSLTPWLIVSRLHTSTLTVSGSANLEQPRLMLGMSDNESLSRDLVADARAFLQRPPDHGDGRFGVRPAGRREHLPDERAHARARAGPRGTAAARDPGNSRRQARHQRRRRRPRARHWRRTLSARWIPR